MGTPGSRPVVFDAGALIEFDRGDSRMRALVRLARDRASTLVIPAGALAQAWRDGSRQARLAALVGSETTIVEVLDEPAAKAAGVLCGRSRTSDIVDASVVVAARAYGAVVVTTDPGDLRRIDPALDVHPL